MGNEQGREVQSAIFPNLKMGLQALAAGEFNGQLKAQKGKRKLADWIAKGEYPNSIKLLESYRMIKAMKIF